MQPDLEITRVLFGLILNGRSLVKFMVPVESFSVGLSAGVNQMRGNLQFAANAASLLHDLRPDDIRHGSALDFSSLPPALRGVATDSVQVGLGHSSEVYWLHQRYYLGEASGSGGRGFRARLRSNSLQ